MALAIIGTLVLGATSFLMSWDALQVVAGWAAVRPALTWGLPLSVDSAIVVFTLLALINRQRSESTVFAWSAVGFFTLASIGGNVSHSLADTTVTGWQVGVAATAAAMFPVVMFASAHSVASVVVAPAPAQTARRAVAATVDATATVTLPAATKTPAPRQVTATPAARTARPTASAEIRAEAIALSASGASRRDVGQRLNVGASTITRWVREAEAAAQEITV